MRNNDLNGRFGQCSLECRRNFRRNLGFPPLVGGLGEYLDRGRADQGAPGGAVGTPPWIDTWAPSNSSVEVVMEVQSLPVEMRRMVVDR